MALITLRPDTELVTSVLEEMLTYLNPDGTFQVCLTLSSCYCQYLLDEANEEKTLFTKALTDLFRPQEASI